MQQVIHTRTSSSNFDRASSGVRRINQSWIYLQPYHQGLNISQLQVQEFLMLEVSTILWGILYSSPAIWPYLRPMNTAWFEVLLTAKQTSLSYHIWDSFRVVPNLPSLGGSPVLNLFKLSELVSIMGDIWQFLFFVFSILLNDSTSAWKYLHLSAASLELSKPAGICGK